jgi:hypothetical protein
MSAALLLSVHPRIMRNGSGIFRETALIVEAGITGGYLPARV